METARGYKEEGATTTPFDTVARSHLDRFHLVSAVIDRVLNLGHVAASVKGAMRAQLSERREYITHYGQDMPAIRD